MIELKTEARKEDIMMEVLSKPKFIEVIYRLRPTDEYVIDICNETMLVDLFCDNADEFMEILRSTVFRIIKQIHQDMDVSYEYRNLRVRLSIEANIKLHEIKPEHTNKPVTFDAEIIGVDERKAYIKEGDFICPTCFDTVHMKADYDRELISPRCYNTAKCKGIKMSINKKTVKLGYVQTLIIQEPVEASVNNSPIPFVAKIIDNNIGTVFPGQKKRITAALRFIAEKDINEHDIFLDIMSISDLEEVNTIKPTDEELKHLKEEALKPEFIDLLIESFAPHIYGYRDIKKSIILQLAGGVRTNKRGEINILLVGDPSMAKSELLKEAKRVTQKSIYASGKGSSSAGLTAGMVKLSNGTSIARLGVYPLCHRGYALIDEFDKMSTEDRSGLHEAMEQGTVSLAKAGVNMTVPAEVTTLAAANPQYGRYDVELSLAENINLPPPLLSRFDLIWLVVDKIDDLSDTYKAKHVLKSFGKKIDTKCFLSNRAFMAYINYVKELTPELSPEASEKLLSLYKKMRELSKNEKNALPVGIRQLEALVRLCMAHAKLLFKSTVEVSDVDNIIDIFKGSYKSFGIDIDTGKFDQMTLTGVTEKETKIQIAYRVWNQLKDKNGEVDTATFITGLAQENKYNENSARRLVQEWTTNGIIKLAVTGKWILA